MKSPIFVRTSLARNILLIGGLCLIALAYSGCTGLVSGGSTTPGTPTVAISASPGTVNAGQSATLTWTSTNATSASIDNGIGAVALSGNTAVTPTQTTTYHITVGGTGGTATSATTVTVNTVGAPTITFTASPSIINAGDSSELTWSTTNATTVSIDNGIGTVATSGNLAVTPATTTTYTLTATGTGGTTTAPVTITVNPLTAPTVTLTANPTTITKGQSSTLTAVATNATQVIITDNIDQLTYTLPAAGGTQVVTPTTTTTYTATAYGSNGQTAASSATVTLAGDLTSINHVIFLMQENRTFDEYFGMLNPYRIANGYNKGDDGVEYDVDGIDDKLTTFTNYNDEGDPFMLFKLTSTCIDDDTSSWLESYGDVNRYDFLTTRPILMDGFVHVAENYAKGGFGGGDFTDTIGKRAMGYYDEGFLNYYYFMASNFALSDRWFSPVSSESTPNRIATYTGGTTQGLVRDPGADDKLPQLSIKTIFEELQDSSVSWKIYYTVTQDQCLADNDGDCGTGMINKFPASTFEYFTYSLNYLYVKSPTRPTCTGTTEDSGTAVGDPNNAFCIDLNHVAPISQYFIDVAAGTLPSFAYIEPGYSNNDEHPGSGQSILLGQVQMSTVMNSLLNSPSWKDSVMFWAYDEGGGPFDHVPPVPGHTNDNTDTSLGVTTDITSIAVNADQYNPCVPPGGIPTLHCDLYTTDPGAHDGDAAMVYGFAAQLGFRLPNMIISPFTRKHYVSHTPLDHTAVIRFVENRFIGPTATLTARDASQPDLTEFFDFTNVPWAVPPKPPQPVTAQSLGYDPCDATNFGP